MMNQYCNWRTLTRFVILVYEDGNVCISILHSMTDPMYDFEGDARWKPVLGVEAILLSVISMLNDPNIESAANVDASL